MANKFSITPAELVSDSSKLDNCSSDFINLSNVILEKVDSIVNSEYISPDAMVLANRIYAYKDELANMGKTFAQYGSFCNSSAQKMINRQNQNISNIKL